MHLPNFLLILSLILPSIIIASPFTTRQVNQEEYYLKTRTIDPFSDKNNLYVVTYHTGAGLNDAVLVSNITYASKGYFNDGFQLFDFRTIFPWRMTLGGASNNAGEALAAF